MLIYILNLIYSLIHQLYAPYSTTKWGDLVFRLLIHKKFIDLKKWIQNVHKKVYRKVDRQTQKSYAC